MLQPDLQSRVLIALTTTITDEWSLFTPATGTSTPSERSIAFHLGWNLRPTIGKPWDVDCDYDRSGMELEPSVAFGDGPASPPDLIVHRRGRLGPENNLLLVHLSADFASQAAEKPDFAAARAVQYRFGYRYAVWVDMRVTSHEDIGMVVSPLWQWATLEEGPLTPAPVPVYSTDELAAIHARAN